MIRRLAVVVYARLLVAFPRAHRARYAAEMVEAFRRALSERASRGSRWRTAVFAFAAFGDAITAGLGERGRGGRAGRARLGLVEDVRHAIRSLARSWTFSFVCLFSLASGLGVAGALVFLFRVTAYSPYPLDTARLAEVVARVPGDFDSEWSYPEFTELERSVEPLALSGWAGHEATLRAHDTEPAERVGAAYVSTNYFETIGVPTDRGRSLAKGDERADEGVPTVVSHAMWQSRLGGDPDVVGRVLFVDRRPHVVVGVAPPGFRFHTVGLRPDLWVPLSEHPSLRTDGSRLDRETQWVRIVGRLTEGATIDEADAAVRATTRGLADRFPETGGEREGRVLPYRWQGADSAEVGRIIRAIFTAIAATLLLVVCLNLAGMVLVRSATRERELAIRLAVGAGRRRLVQYLMIEAGMLALAGGGLVVLVLMAAVQVIAWRLQMPVPDSLGIGLPDIGLAIGASLLTTVVFGLLPALRYSRPALLVSLKDDGAGGGRRPGLAQRISASLQAGLAIPVLVVAGGITQGAASMRVADFGVEQGDLFVATPVDLQVEGYRPDAALTFAEAMVDATRSAAGVEAVALSDGAPLDGVRRYVQVERTDGAAVAVTRFTRIGEGYFEALGTPILRGRSIDVEDRAGTEPVAVVTASLADRLFAGGSPLGRRLLVRGIPLAATGDGEAGVGDPQRAPALTIVGVTADVAGPFLESDTEGLFVSYRQAPTTTVSLAVRASPGSESPAGVIQSLAAGLDRDLARMPVLPFDALVEARAVDFGAWKVFFAIVSSLLLLLSSLGIYGVVAFAVANRTREIGIRMSLGSSRRRVLKGVVRDSLRLALPGLVLGTVGGVLVGRAVLNRMYAQIGLPMADARIMLVAALIALAIVVIASLAPARRAASVDPMEALRAA